MNVTTASASVPIAVRSNASLNSKPSSTIRLSSRQRTGLAELEPHVSDGQRHDRRRPYDGRERERVGLPVGERLLDRERELT